MRPIGSSLWLDGVKSMREVQRHASLNAASLVQIRARTFMQVKDGILNISLYAADIVPGVRGGGHLGPESQCLHF